ncbi:hypothetical protein A2630_03680 [Candidatus Woesebacteria bacterium RIFCSPHIGHO2_01_FULL_44_10]|uniref:Transcription elongation factor GreA n=1 Tax=Candidatus Woesebacteria bacterium RIFCSPLOWO2_01_FULL_44_14 TaxID=1802525 RepID=A0A1F8C1S5_9BACT|nr:MAG: hypothetical protein A2630_03680 [Candidatus Woesebacteria bacterium RIFCSPHIGHO2_01_FULL_44_10]OGM54903.1 MAG: hypothetical protein A3F62_04430 [Candidatus Woesebacteria bacterium RIFCSPHIGHO2_12_FULL_44_11]OGM70314.1 MAG: hypothetical protein A2975_04575 [Candidatus Woesebacteria bacterium RIFCSPLOWO2_01_FULL_44_14]
MLFQMIQITQKGLDSLKSELDELVSLKRPKLVERLSRAREEGDLAENSDYSSAKDELDFLDGRIAELTEVVDHAEVVKGSNGDGTVAVGTVVTVSTNNTTTDFNIVGDWEADPIAKKISHTSPLGQALVGKKKGDRVEVAAPAGKLNYEILSVKPAS